MASGDSGHVNISYSGPDADLILARSASRWQTALRLAESIRGIPEDSLDLQGVLCRTPSLPERIPSSSISIEGYSTWKNSDASCRLRKVERPLKIFLRKRDPVSFTISSSHNFTDWEGGPNNGIALLMTGWAYILSASLAERQNLSMEYGPMIEGSGPEIDLDYALPQELAWWKALVSGGIGWSIAGNQISPWAVQVEDIGVRIAGQSDGSQHPPTSREAASYLARLCHVYGLGSQCSAALAAALTIPLHSSISPLKPGRVELPRLSFQSRIAMPIPDQQDYPTEFNDLGYYMSLSICPWIFGPALWSVFWDPDVPCNFAGAWLGPIVSVLDPIIKDDNLELLCKVLSFTKFAPLWLGVSLCGRRAIVKSIVPSLAELRDYPYATPGVDSAAWTGVPQSFLDIHPPGPYLRNGMVSRADVWRLRHDCNRKYEDNAFSYTPTYGWPPFGEMKAEDVEFEIRGHLRCSHQWKYATWTWLPDNITDDGFRTDSPAASLWQRVDAKKLRKCRIPKGENLVEASELATKRVFWWCCTQVEKGFSGTLVERWYGNEKARESAEPGLKAADHEAIQKWLENIS